MAKKQGTELGIPGCSCTWSDSKEWEGTEGGKKVIAGKTWYRVSFACKTCR